ncbi:MAG: hypothetical protein IPM56_16225 [Ignavibacteriales bacterium]|nr:MAG: hypothetical protein IPM56_16225 [Ignavibacteriales bacterium]
MKELTVLLIIQVLKKFGYKVFDNNKPFNLNIVGIRSNNNKPNQFDDTLVVFYKDESGKWKLHQWKITTDPGLYYLKNPLNVEGAAILVEDQYESAYQIGKHRGKYEALVQVKPVKVIRDANRDGVLDFGESKQEAGLFGINIHRAYPVGETTAVDKWSAGCQVFKDAEEFRDFMQLCYMSARRYGNSFTYTLLNETDFESEKQNEISDSAA